MNIFAFSDVGNFQISQKKRYLTRLYNGYVPYPKLNDIELLTLPEAALRLRVNRRTLERLIAAKEFPAPLKIGSRSLVPLADLNAYFAELLRRRNGRATA
jgi:excisionase family DNA binding protein